MIVTTSSRDVDTRSGRVFVEGLQHWQCPQCDAQVETPDQMDFNAKLIQVALKNHREACRKEQGLLRGDEIRALRKKFSLTQAQAAQLFGGGPVAFSKYESEDTAQSTPMNRLLQLSLIDNPENLLLLAERHHVELAESTRGAISRSGLLDKLARYRQSILAFEATTDAKAIVEIISVDMDAEPANEALYSHHKTPLRRHLSVTAEDIQAMEAA